MPAAGTWRHVITASFVLLGIALLATGVRAQSDPEPEGQSTPDHYYYQFYGNAADVTIDGEPLQTGDSITPILNGKAVTQAVVDDDGFFLTFKHLFQEPPIGDCNVVFEINSQRLGQTVSTREFSYASGCGDIPVELAIVTTGGAGTETGAADEDDTLEETAFEEADDVDTTEQASVGDQTESQSAQVGTQRPHPPRTGTGGVYVRESQANWPIVAGVLFLLVALIGMVTVMVKRRTDQSPR